MNSIKALIEKLQCDMPDIEAVQDIENPVIVHLKTRAAKNGGDQILDQKATIQFLGAARNLPDEIGRHTNGGIELTRILTWPSVTPDDQQTIVSVKAEGRFVRSILSDCMPLSRYSSFLWLAIRTNTKDITRFATRQSVCWFSFAAVKIANTTNVARILLLKLAALIA